MPFLGAKWEVPSSGSIMAVFGTQHTAPCLSLGLMGLWRSASEGHHIPQAMRNGPSSSGFVNPYQSNCMRSHDVKAEKSRIKKTNSCPAVHVCIPQMMGRARTGPCVSFSIPFFSSLSAMEVHILGLDFFVKVKASVYCWRSTTVLPTGARNQRMAIISGERSGGLLWFGSEECLELKGSWSLCIIDRIAIMTP